MSKARLVVALCGAPPAEVSKVHSGYRAWFRAGLGPEPEIHMWDAHVGAPCPDLGQWDGLVVTGSKYSWREPLPFMEGIIESIRTAAELERPILGVCFGHQAIATAFGGQVSLAPDGGEHGSVEVCLNDAGKEDPLFAGLPERFFCQGTHFDEVDKDTISPANGLRVTAYTDRCQVAAFAGPGGIRGVQFHPEFSQELMQTYLVHQERDKHAEESPWPQKIFENWQREWLGA